MQSPGTNAITNIHNEHVAPGKGQYMNFQKPSVTSIHHIIVEIKLAMPMLVTAIRWYHFVHLHLPSIVVLKMQPGQLVCSYLVSFAIWQDRRDIRGPIELLGVVDA